MERWNLAVTDFGVSMGLPTLALDDRGCATLKIGEELWTMQAVDDGQSLLLVHTIGVPFCTAAQLESALIACHAHMQPAHAPGTLRLGANGQGAAAQWSGCLRLTTTTSSQALAQGIGTLRQWLAECARAAKVAGSY